MHATRRLLNGGLSLVCGVRTACGRRARYGNETGVALGRLVLRYAAPLPAGATNAQLAGAAAAQMHRMLFMTPPTPASPGRIFVPPEGVSVVGSGRQSLRLVVRVAPPSQAVRARHPCAVCGAGWWCTQLTCACVRACVRQGLANGAPTALELLRSLHLATASSAAAWSLSGSGVPDMAHALELVSCELVVAPSQSEGTLQCAALPWPDMEYLRPLGTATLRSCDGVYDAASPSSARCVVAAQRGQCSSHPVRRMLSAHSFADHCSLRDVCARARVPACLPACVSVCSLVGAVRTDSDVPGFTGGGYADFSSAPGGEAVRFNLTGCRASMHTLRFRYDVGSGNVGSSPQTMRLVLNGAEGLGSEGLGSRDVTFGEGGRPFTTVWQVTCHVHLPRCHNTHPPYAGPPLKLVCKLAWVGCRHHSIARDDGRYPHRPRGKEGARVDEEVPWC